MQDLQIPIDGHPIWNQFIRALQVSHIRLNDHDDDLLWAVLPSGKYSTKAGYITLCAPLEPPNKQWWWHSIWKLQAAHKTRLLLWFILNNFIPTIENLHRRAIHGSSRCCFFLSHVEEVQHLFLE